MSRNSRRNWATAAQVGTTALLWATSWNPMAKFFVWASSSMLINAIMPGPENVLAASPSYSWRRTPNDTAAANTPMPVLYGTARIKPVLKNRFVTVKDDRQYIHALYGFTGHRIDEIATLSDWLYATDYIVGDEVKPPATYGGAVTAEPGKTYRCRRTHTSAWNMDVLPWPSDYTTITWLDAGYWETGAGTADIQDIRINGTPATEFVTANADEFHYETRPGLAEQTQLDGFDRIYVTHIPPITPQSALITLPVLDAAAILDVGGMVNIWYRGIRYSVKLGALTQGVGYQNYYWLPGGAYLLSDTQTVMPEGAFYIALVYIDERGIGKWISYYYETLDATPADTGWYTVTMNSVTAQNLEVMLQWPAGLYTLSSAGKLVETRAFVFAQYRLYGTEDWFNFSWVKADFNRINQQLVSIITHTNGMKAASFPGKTAEAFWKQFHAAAEDDLLPEGRYQVRVAVISAQAVTLEAISAITYGGLNEDGARAGLTYPGEALLAVHALATDKLNGDLEVTGVATRSTVPVYDGTDWYDADATAHAWACYDILANGHPDHPDYPAVANDPELIQPIYGTGVDPSRLDYDSFAAAAEYMRTDLGWKLGIVFDTVMTAWDAVLRICMEGRIIVYPIGARFYALVDKAETPSGLIGPGNIDEDTFTETWLDPATKADSLEMSFPDEDRNYELTSFTIRAGAWDDSVLRDPLQFQLYGTTAYVQAFALGRYLLSGNLLQRRVFTARLNVESLQLSVGDVVVVSHAVLGGWGGKLVAGSMTGCTLDQTVTIPAGVSYTFYARSINDVMVTNAFTVPGSVAWTTNKLTWAPAAVALRKDDDWVLVPTAALALARIIDIDFDSNYARTVTALEYDKRVYQSNPDSTDSAIVTAAKLAAGSYAPGADVSVTNVAKIAPELTLPTLAPFATAAGLALSEQISHNRATGEWESHIVASWRIPDNHDHAEYEVSWRDVDAGDTGWVGAWAAGTSYNAGALVTHDGDSYVSMENDNTTEPVS